MATVSSFQYSLSFSIELSDVTILPCNFVMGGLMWGRWQMASFIAGCWLIFALIVIYYFGSKSLLPRYRLPSLISPTEQSIQSLLPISLMLRNLLKRTFAIIRYECTAYASRFHELLCFPFAGQDLTDAASR